VFALRRRAVLTWAASAWALPANAQPISKAAAVALAESFIAKNGYTQLPREQINTVLAPESFELASNREEQLTMRFNRLRPKAIGIKRGGKGESRGWSVAFDFASTDADASNCRVVTMTEDGQNLVLQHVDGIRRYFVGFD
jgi:hypothetical protein